MDNLPKENPTRWFKALSNEWGRLSHGNDAGVEYTDTIEYIAHTEVPKNEKVTYASFVCDCRPLKDEQWRVRLVVGGDKLPYDSDSGSPTTDMIETKLLINSTISDADKGARFATLDLKDMFLHTKMDNPEYMKVSLKYFLPDVIQRYNLHALVHNGYITMRINKGMYGLKQAALLAYETVSSLLIKSGYTPIAGSLGLWTHKTRDLSFCLCVDDFGVKYKKLEDLHHLQETLQEIYTVKSDYRGDFFWDSLYNGIIMMDMWILACLDMLIDYRQNYNTYLLHHHNIPLMNVST